MSFEPWDIGAAVRDWFLSDHKARESFTRFLESKGLRAVDAHSMIHAILNAKDLSDALKDTNGDDLTE